MAKMTKDDRYTQLQREVAISAAAADGAHRDDLFALLGEIKVYAEYSGVFKVSHLEDLEKRAAYLMATA